MVLRLLRDPEISNKVILQFAFRQAKALGYAKVLSAILGAVIVAVSSFIKVPQILKILRPDKPMQRAQLAEGLSKKSIYLETVAQFIHVTYNKQQKNSFVNYGESLLLGLQNAVLVLILEYYRIRKEVAEYSVNTESEQEKECLHKLMTPALSLVGLVVFITKLAPTKLVLAIQLINIPVAVLAKIPQIKRNAEIRSTSHLSKITIGANVAGSLIRVFTTIAGFKKTRTRDSVLLAGYLTSFSLNAIIAAQIYQFCKEKTE